MSDAKAGLLSLIASSRVPSQGELSEIVHAIADAEFLDPGSLERHHRKRMEEGQWSRSTSVEEFGDDLRSICLAAHTLGVYETTRRQHRGPAR